MSLQKAHELLIILIIIFINTSEFHSNIFKLPIFATIELRAEHRMNTNHQCSFCVIIVNHLLFLYNYIYVYVKNCVLPL